MKKTYRLDGLGCANCAAKMERAIGKLPGVREVTINFLTTKMALDAEDEQFDGIVKEAERIIVKIEPDVLLKRA